jgi:hypothetical protein
VQYYYNTPAAGLRDSLRAPGAGAAGSGAPGFGARLRRMEDASKKSCDTDAGEMSIAAVSSAVDAAASSCSASTCARRTAAVMASDQPVGMT